MLKLEFKLLLNSFQVPELFLVLPSCSNKDKEQDGSFRPEVKLKIKIWILCSICLLFFLNLDINNSKNIKFFFFFSIRTIQIFGRLIHVYGLMLEPWSSYFKSALYRSGIYTNIAVISL